MTAPVFKTLTLEMRITRMKSECFPELVYSISGRVSEHGETFGRSSPLRREELNKEFVDNWVKHSCNPGTWGLDSNEFRIVPVVVEDCRVRQTRLF